MNPALLKFDRDITLVELVRAVPRPKLMAALTTTIGGDWRIVDADGMSIIGADLKPAGPVNAVPLRIDFEVLGHLQTTENTGEPVTAAATWLELVLASSYRYQMAADLHLEAVHADYEALQRQHAALQESEARYRELANQLEQRVKAQVDVIERTQRQLYQTEKMASIGSLSAGMAHEINNPIGFIRSNLGTASAYVDKIGKALAALHGGDLKGAETVWRDFDIDFVLEDFPGLLAESIAGADRITRIVANLKAYASIDSMTSDTIDLNESVRAAARVISDQLPDNIKLDMDLQPLPNIVGDQSRMNQVFFALTQNARLALSGDGGWIRVGSRIHDDEIRVTVRDNGCGIPQDMLNRIFDPFFTTRDVGKGMGLGLTVSRDIVAAHAGRIEVQTSQGEGCTFIVCLPFDVKSESRDATEGAP
jgi:two-component system NtrC family sensor kinase